MLPEAVAAVLWTGVTLYAVLGGADFGGGFWDLLAGSPKRGAAARRLIEKSMGPVWEANHVWLIFGIVTLWTGFPSGFTAVMTTLWIPLTAAALGIILRGAAFAFRNAVVALPERRGFGAIFAFSSILSPWFLGAAAGAVASGRVPSGNAAGAPVASWLGPTSLLGGALAVLVCAHLAAVYLTGDAARAREEALALSFRRKALLTGVLTGALSLSALLVIRHDATHLFDGLAERGAPAILAAYAAGFLSLAALWFRKYVLARPCAAGAVAAVIWGWGLAQYPDLLPGHLALGDAAAHPSSLRAILVALAFGVVLLAPSLWFLFRLQATASAESPAPRR